MNIYAKRNDFESNIVNVPFLDGDGSRRPSYGVYTSQLIRFVRECRYVQTDFHARNKSLTTKLLQQGYRYHRLQTTNSMADTMNCRFEKLYAS